MGLIGEQEVSDTISVKSYKGTLLIGTLPIIGDILLYKWYKSKDVRLNKQNMCKAYLQTKLIMLYPLSLAVFILGILIGKI